MKILQQAVSEFHFRKQNSSSFPNSLLFRGRRGLESHSSS